MSWNSQYSNKQPPKGILRSKTSRYQFERKRVVESNTSPATDKDEELLIFGYACKLFPPDDHSRDIFKGRHLIPWNGDEKLQLMIDRYDARASLHDLSDFDGDSWNTEYDISEEEARIEQLCDQERYMAMYTDIAEEKLRHEEELKRLHASIEGGNSFNQVGFNYDTTNDKQLNETGKVTSDSDKPEDKTEDIVEEKPFMAPASLAIPPHMEIPPTEKMHAIIEKTATFVSKQGVQMEIILKAKQANTSQFLFLDFDHYLNPYYKHVLKRMKEGKYKPEVKNEEKEDDEDEDEESDSDEDGGYLHPSLFANAQRNKQQEEEKKEKLKAIQKVDPNHPLAKLIEKGKKANALRQYNLMKLATQNYAADKENALEPPPLPKFMDTDSHNSSAASSPLSLQDQDALPPSITPQEAAMVIVPPPPDIQPMVDSVAKQIAEEGDTVEQSMRKREDPLLAFLQPSHELHPYYTFRKTFIREQMKARKRMVQQAKELAAAEEQMKQSNPISFSIKGKDAVPKTTLISTRLQLLEGESDYEESTDADAKADDNAGDSQVVANKAKEASIKPKEKTKRKFVEISVVEGIKPKSEPEVPTPTSVTSEDKASLLEQSKRKFTDAPPVISVPAPSISNFTVVTPDGNSMSIAEFREKQQKRRQKAAQLAMEKAKMVTITPVPEPDPTKKDPASEDIFGSSDEEETDEEIVPIVVASNSTVEKPSKTEKQSKPRSPAVEQKSSPQPSTAKPARTLKDLIAEASRSSTPSKDSKRHRSKSQSRDRSSSRSRSRTSSPHRRKKARSKSRERDFVPSSYKRILGSSSSRYNKYNDSDTANIPSAYKIENPSYSYGNASYSRYGRREMSPVRRSHKRHRDSTEREGGKKKHRSNSLSSHKSKRKHSKSQKRHKKKKSKSKKKKRRKDSSSDSRSSNSNSESSNSDSEKKSNGKMLSLAKETVAKEEGECSPSSSHEFNS